MDPILIGLAFAFVSAVSGAIVAWSKMPRLRKWVMRSRNRIAGFISADSDPLLPSPPDRSLILAERDDSHIYNPHLYNKIKTHLYKTVKNLSDRYEILSLDVSCAEDGSLAKKLNRPFRLASSVGALDAYAESLENVESRFFTTSYLSSGFWTRQNSDGVMEANRYMLLRIKGSGEAKRIFLVDLPPSDKIKEQGLLLRHFLQEGSESEANKLREGKRVLSERVLALEELSCETRVVFDDPDMFKYMSRAYSPFTYGDTEVAIYDRFGVHMYKGGSLGYVSSVDCFTEAFEGFGNVLSHAESYFDSLWNSPSAVPAVDFLSELDEAFAKAESNIDIDPRGLAPYEHPTSKEDRELKRDEYNTFVSMVCPDGGSKFKRHLDIGTCTARYPIAVQADINIEIESDILGIDIDADCVAFSKGRCLSLQSPPPPIDIQQIDLMDVSESAIGRFDLITMMMGTVSHFGYEMGRIEKAARCIYSVANNDGLVVVSAWTPEAAKQRRLIENLYRDSDVPRLSEWSPAPTDLKLAFENAGLRFVDAKPVGWRLNVFLFAKS